jgi:hypothetical protein
MPAKRHQNNRLLSVMVAKYSPSLCPPSWRLQALTYRQLGCFLQGPEGQGAIKVPLFLKGDLGGFSIGWLIIPPNPP